MDVWCLHSSTQINTSVKADRFLWLQREEWLHKPGLRWNLPGAVTPFIQKAQLRRFDVFFPFFPALLFSPNIETTSPRRKLLPNAVTLASLTVMVFKSWVFWCFLRLRLTPVTMQRLNPRGSIGNHVLKSISHWDFSSIGDLHWKAVQIEYSTATKHHVVPWLWWFSILNHQPSNVIPTARLLADCYHRKVTCIARFRAPLLHIFQHGSGLRRNTKIPNWWKKSTLDSIYHYFSFVLSPY